MILYPNQKEVVIHKEPADNKKQENYYTKINLIALQNAMQALKPNTFKLWIYLSSNQENYTLALSSQDVCNVCDMVKSTYTKCVKELIEKRYLIQRDNTNVYDFYEIPKAASTHKAIEEQTKASTENIIVMQKNTEDIILMQNREAEQLRQMGVKPFRF